LYLLAADCLTGERTGGHYESMNWLRLACKSATQQPAQAVISMCDVSWQCHSTRAVPSVGRCDSAYGRAVGLAIALACPETRPTHQTAEWRWSQYDV